MSMSWVAYSLKGYEVSQKISSDSNVVSRRYKGEKLFFMTGNFDNVDWVLSGEQLDYPILSTGKNEIIFGKYEGIIFLSEEIARIVGFTGIPDELDVDIGYKRGTVTSNKLMKSDETQKHTLEISLLGKHLTFIYTNIIEYQYVRDAKAPLLPVIDSKKRL